MSSILADYITQIKSEGLAETTKWLVVESNYAVGATQTAHDAVPTQIAQFIIGLADRSDYIIGFRNVNVSNGDCLFGRSCGEPAIMAALPIRQEENHHDQVPHHKYHNDSDIRLPQRQH